MLPKSSSASDSAASASIMVKPRLAAFRARSWPFQPQRFQNQITVGGPAMRNHERVERQPASSKIAVAAGIAGLHADQKIGPPL